MSEHEQTPPAINISAAELKSLLNNVDLSALNTFAAEFSSSDLTVIRSTGGDGIDHLIPIMSNGNADHNDEDLHHHHHHHFGNGEGGSTGENHNSIDAGGGPEDDVLNLSLSPLKSLDFACDVVQPLPLTLVTGIGNGHHSSSMMMVKQLHRCRSCPAMSRDTTDYSSPDSIGHHNHPMVNNLLSRSKSMSSVNHLTEADLLIRYIYPFKREKFSGHVIDQQQYTITNEHLETIDVLGYKLPLVTRHLSNDGSSAQQQQQELTTMTSSSSSLTEMTSSSLNDEQYVCVSDVFQTFFSRRHWDEFKEILAKNAIHPVNGTLRNTFGQLDHVTAISVDQCRSLLLNNEARKDGFVRCIRISSFDSTGRTADHSGGGGFVRKSTDNRDDTSLTPSTSTPPFVFNETKLICASERQVGELTSGIRTRHADQSDILYVEFDDKTLPSITVNDSQYVRLVDIQKNILSSDDLNVPVLSKHVSLLKSICDRAGIIVTKCRPNEKARLVVYANSYRSSSLHVILAEDLPKLVAYYRRFKEHRTLRSLPNERRKSLPTATTISSSSSTASKRRNTAIDDSVGDFSSSFNYSVGTEDSILTGPSSKKRFFDEDSVSWSINDSHAPSPASISTDTASCSGEESLRSGSCFTSRLTNSTKSNTTYNKKRIKTAVAAALNFDQHRKLPSPHTLTSNASVSRAQSITFGPNAKPTNGETMTPSAAAPALTNPNRLHHAAAAAHAAPVNIFEQILATADEFYKKRGAGGFNNATSAATARFDSSNIEHSSFKANKKFRNNNLNNNSSFASTASESTATSSTNKNKLLRRNDFKSPHPGVQSGTVKSLLYPVVSQSTAAAAVGSSSQTESIKQRISRDLRDPSRQKSAKSGGTQKQRQFAPPQLPPITIAPDFTVDRSLDLDLGFDESLLYDHMIDQLTRPCRIYLEKSAPLPVAVYNRNYQRGPAGYYYDHLFVEKNAECILCCRCKIMMHLFQFITHSHDATGAPPIVDPQLFMFVRNPNVDRFDLWRNLCTKAKYYDAVLKAHVNYDLPSDLAEYYKEEARKNNQYAIAAASNSQSASSSTNFASMVTSTNSTMMRMTSSGSNFLMTSASSSNSAMMTTSSSNLRVNNSNGGRVDEQSQQEVRSTAAILMSLSRGAK